VAKKTKTGIWPPARLLPLCQRAKTNKEGAVKRLKIQLNAILQKLKLGDRRSTRGVPEVVDRVLANPRLFPVVFDGMSDSDPLVRMRCSDAVEKITIRRPESLAPYKKPIIELAAVAEQQEVRWHLAHIISRIKLNKPERQRIAEILFGYLNDESKIVKTFSMQALADIAAQDSELRGPIIGKLEELTIAGSPAMKSRGRKLLARLNQSDERPNVRARRIS
jgi:hypothetical protein